MFKDIFTYLIMMFMKIKCKYELIVKIIIFIKKPHTDHRHRSIFVICVPAFRRMVVGEGAVFNPDGVPAADGGAVEGAAPAAAGVAVSGVVTGGDGWGRAGLVAPTRAQRLS